MFKALSDNLNLLMARARINSNELARCTGLPATTIKRIRNNEQANPTISTLVPIANYFAISLNDLISSVVPKTSLTAKQSYGKTIPILTWQQCIDFNKLNYNNISHKVFTEKKVSDKSYALFLKNSEWDFFPNNSLLIIDPLLKVNSGDFVIITKSLKNSASLKKYLIDADKIFLKSLINGLSIETLTSKHRLLGVVVQYKVELRTDVE
jgi:SOS-response transcriptional repressor LexA